MSILIKGQKTKKEHLWATKHFSEKLFLMKKYFFEFFALIFKPLQSFHFFKKTGQNPAAFCLFTFFLNDKYSKKLTING